jgi:hypothetical protein
VQSGEKEEKKRTLLVPSSISFILSITFPPSSFLDSHTLTIISTLAASIAPIALPSMPMFSKPNSTMVTWGCLNGVEDRMKEDKAAWMLLLLQHVSGCARVCVRADIP